MNKMKKFSIIAITLLITISLFSSMVYADNFDIGAFEDKGEGLTEVKGFVNNTAATIIHFISFNLFKKFNSVL